ncbi:MAG: response regulator, partial [Chloroflexota bacterium]
MIRVLIADDHDVVREGLAGFLGATTDMELIGEASDGAEAVRLCALLMPDVVLMDLVMPLMDGIAATAAIRAAHGDTVKVVILTSFGDRDRVENALKAGAIGYLLKNSSVHEMTTAIRAAVAGRAILSPEATNALVQSQQQPKHVYNLKPRELEVLALLVGGKTNDQIAYELNLSRSTIKFHVSALLAKLGAESRTEAAAIAVREGLVPDPNGDD